MKMKLTPVFMLAVICIAAFVPVAFGISVHSIGAAVGVVAFATMFIEPAAGIAPAKFAQRGEVGESIRKVEEQYKEVQASLKSVGDQLKAHAENAEREIKSHSKMTEETRASVDKLLLEQGGLSARLLATEQAMAKFESGGGQPENPKSLGEMVAESEQFKAFNPNAGTKFSVPIKAAITSLPDSGGALIQTQRVAGVVATPQRRMTIRDLLAPGRTSSNAIEYVRETGFTNNAAPVSENPANPKPESDIEFELLQKPVATIAHFIRASKQVLSDAAMLQSYIDGRLRYGLMLKEELQLLKGSGTGLNLSGIYTQATAYANPGVAVQAQTRIDQIRLALLQAALAEYDADAIVLNPIDWAAIELTKSADQKYIIANPQGAAAPMLWNRPVVATQSMDVEDFLVGAFKMGAQIWDNEDAVVTVSTEDRDNFVKNMVTILCEERLGLAVYRPEAFVKGTFEDVSA